MPAAKTKASRRIRLEKNHLQERKRRDRWIYYRDATHLAEGMVLGLQNGASSLDNPEVPVRAPGFWLGSCFL